MIRNHRKGFIAVVSVAVIITLVSTGLRTMRTAHSVPTRQVCTSLADTCTHDTTAAQTTPPTRTSDRRPGRDTTRAHRDKRKKTSRTQAASPSRQKPRSLLDEKF